VAFRQDVQGGHLAGHHLSRYLWSLQVAVARAGGLASLEQQIVLHVLQVNLAVDLWLNKQPPNRTLDHSARHVSPVAIESAIHLLDSPTSLAGRGDIGETGPASAEIVNR
jgi:hypothetical protein